MILLSNSVYPKLMSLLSLISAETRTRANRFVGRFWLVVFFFFLLAINIANSTIVPMLGTLAPIFEGALIVSTIWIGVLLATIGCGHAWARFVLVGFLFAFVIGQALFIIHIIVEHPSLKDEPLRLIAIVGASYIFAAIYLLVSADIRQIGHHVID